MGDETYGFKLPLGETFRAVRDQGSALDPPEGAALWTPA